MAHGMDFERRLRVRPKRFRLADADPGDTGTLTKGAAAKLREHSLAELQALQDRLWAEDARSLLLVFQALDAAGKDGTIAHVMSGVNPQGCDVHAFKAPTHLELDHDWLWRCQVALPERGRIGIFNRSYYEEVLVVRVHPEILAAQPGVDAREPRIWRQRFEAINAFETHLARNGTRVVKFFLHVSKAEQKRRFLDRIEEPAKNWKFSAADIRERAHWDAYQHAYDEMLRATSTPDGRWYVIPADHKWFMRTAVSSIVRHHLRDLDPAYPVLPADEPAELAAAQAELEAEES